MNKNNTILLFENIECLNKADNRFADIILIKESTELKKISDNIYEVGKEENSYLDLFSCLKSENRLPKRIVFNNISSNSTFFHSIINLPILVTAVFCKIYLLFSFLSLLIPFLCLHYNTPLSNSHLHPLQIP